MSDIMMMILKDKKERDFEKIESEVESCRQWVYGKYGDGKGMPEYQKAFEFDINVYKQYCKY